MTEELKNGTPVAINLKTIHNQDGEVSQYVFEKMGQIVHVNGSYYIRYEEDEFEESNTTTIKLGKDGTITIVRQASSSSRMRFDADESTRMRYQTPAGNLFVDINTHKVQMNYRTNPFSGDIDLTYDLTTGNQLLGRYKMELKFTI